MPVNLKVRIAGMTAESVVDGPGLRNVIFFQGCLHACPGCHNPETWDIRGGREYLSDQVFEQLKFNALIQGITFSGGEPFLQAEAAAYLAGLFKTRSINLWTYTGFVWEDLIIRLHEPGIKELLAQTDVLVEGPFKKDARDINLPFRGSTNQRLIRVKESLRNDRIVHWNPA